MPTVSLFPAIPQQLFLRVRSLVPVVQATKCLPILFDYHYPYSFKILVEAQLWQLIISLDVHWP